MINFLGRSVEAFNFYFDATLILFVCNFVGWSLLLLYMNQLFFNIRIAAQIEGPRYSF